MKIRHVKSLFHIISLEKSHFLFCSLSKIRLRAIILRSHLDGSKALRNYCCECNDLLAKQNPKKSAQEASFGSFYFTFSTLWLFCRDIDGILREAQGYKAHVHFTRLDGACSARKRQTWSSDPEVTHEWMLGCVNWYLFSDRMLRKVALLKI